MPLLERDPCNVGGVVTLSCIFPLFGNIIFWLLQFSTILALFFIIFSGFRIITSEGDPKKLDQAKRSLTFAIIGLILIFLSFAIVAFIGQITGVGCLKATTLLSFESCP